MPSGGVHSITHLSRSISPRSATGLGHEEPFECDTGTAGRARMIEDSSTLPVMGDARRISPIAQLTEIRKEEI